MCSAKAGSSRPSGRDTRCSQCYSSSISLENDTPLLIRALEFAARKHRMQRRKDEDASPYINHPIALISVLCVEVHFCHPVILSAAVLHDTIEDTETTGEELEQSLARQSRALSLR